MNTDRNLQFITNKILDTGVALLHCHSNGILKIPSNIVETYQVDDDGCIWFFMARPKQLVSQFDNQFPVSLHYFKKGNNYSMNIFGKARIIDDPEELANTNLDAQQIDNALNNLLLVCVKILKVDYIDHEYNMNNSLWNRFKTALYDLLNWADSGDRSFEFSPGTGIHHYGF